MSSNKKIYKTTVIVSLSVDGMHKFPGAKDIFPEVSFLEHMHRHMFTFKAALKVNHDNRDREFIMFKRDIQDFLYGKYYLTSSRTHIFGSQSCEMLAREIMNYFDCEWVEVWEDNENGSRIEKENG